MLRVQTWILGAHVSRAPVNSVESCPTIPVLKERWSITLMLWTLVASISFVLVKTIELKSISNTWVFLILSKRFINIVFCWARFAGEHTSAEVYRSAVHGKEIVVQRMIWTIQFLPPLLPSYPAMFGLTSSVKRRIYTPSYPPPPPPRFFRVLSEVARL